MGSGTCLFLIMCKIITTIVAQEFQITVYNKPHFAGKATILNVTGCLPNLQLRNLGAIASVNVSNACAIFYYKNDGGCSLREFSIIPQHNSVAFDLSNPGDKYYGASSVSGCNYCPKKIPARVQAFSFFVSHHEALSGHHWLFNTAEFETQFNQTNICGQILDEFPIPFISVVSGCVQFYSSNNCTTSQPEINKFQSIHGVREWDTLRPVKSFSHCFLHCVPELSRNYVGVRGRYVEEDEPAFSGLRVSLSSGLRENVYAKHFDGGCREAPRINESTVTRVAAKDICVVLYANKNCNANNIVSKPTVLEAKGEKIAAISVPDLFRNMLRVQSYILCKNLARFEDYHLVLAKTYFFKDYATSNTIRIFKRRNLKGASRIINISGCAPLPHRLTKRSSIDSHGKCILLFVENNCTGKYEKLQTGSPILRNMRLLNSIESYKSIHLCSNNAQLTTGVDLHYNFTIKQYGSEGYNWTFSSLANKSATCWEMPYYYRSSTYPALVVHSGCLKLFAGLNCSPFSQHFTITSANKAGDLGDWGMRSSRSFTSCADLVKHLRIQSAVLKQSLIFPYNFPNGTFYTMKSGEISSTFVLKFCKTIPPTHRSNTTQHPMDQISHIYVKNRCIFVFDMEDCTMSENTTLPIILNATDRPLERNLTETPFWSKPVSFVSTIECDNFTHEYKDLQRIYKIENKRPSAADSIHNRTTNQTIYISLLATLAICLGIVILAIILGIVIYFKVKNSQKNKLNKLELDVFYNGSDEPCSSNEDKIQNTAVNKALEIPSSNFTYVKSGDGSPVVLGSGCFGKVIRGILYAGFDELNNCPLTKNVAIKTPKIGITLEQLRPLLCEIKICSFVGKHKNIVEFIGFSIEDIRLGKLSIVLELCENGSLLQYLRDYVKYFQNNCKIESAEQSPSETYDYSQLLRWCQEIAEGMEFLSSKHVLHADLATRNCILDSDLHIKITDFGLSRKLYDYGNYVKTSKAMLPWRWMALESLNSFTFSVKTDVWSYGVCLWEIFSFGGTPYPTRTWDEDFIENLSAGLRLTKPKLCPEYCYQLMRRCWEENPNDRYDFTELRKAISNFQVLGENATRTNVDCGPVIKVEESVKNVNISKCKGQALDSESPMGTRNCNFQNFSKSSLNYQSCLGDGGFGIVLKAQNSDGMPIAVKLLFPPPLPGQDQEMETDEDTETQSRTESDEVIENESVKHRRQMGRECHIPLGLEHSNLVKVIASEKTPFNYANIRNMIDSLLPQEDLKQRRRLKLKCLEADDRGCQEIYWIRMELCGETLWQWLNAKEEHNAGDVQVQLMQCQITLDLIEGVKYLHDRKLIHRDLKSRNIMFAKEGFTLPVKIGDFGLCRILHSEATQTYPITKRVGTRPYWAPEVREREEYSLRADLFSLGLVIWEVVQFISRTTLEDWVYDWKPDLVEEHPLMIGVKEMIEELIKRRPEERPEDIDHLKTYTTVWESILLERGGD